MTPLDCYHGAVPGPVRVAVCLLLLGCGRSHDFHPDPDAGAANQPPVAILHDQVGEMGQRTTIDATESYDPDGDPLDYDWILRARPPATRSMLMATAGPRAVLLPDEAGLYVVELTLWDGIQYGEPSEARVEVREAPPLVADAGPDQTVALGEVVALDGSGSFDPRGRALSYSWEIVDRPAASEATFDDPAEARVTFLADAVGTFECSLYVSTRFSRSEIDTVRVTAIE